MPSSGPSLSSASQTGTVLMFLSCDSWYSSRSWSSFGIHRPSAGAGVETARSPSTGTGAERLFRGLSPTVVFGGVSGGVWSAAGCSISPVHATTVWFQGVSSEERYENESKRADWPRRDFRSWSRLHVLTPPSSSLRGSVEKRESAPPRATPARLRGVRDLPSQRPCYTQENGGY